ncbi:MAG: hypothetical protein AAF694_26980 [Bacteroidota bacterium]
MKNSIVKPSILSHLRFCVICMVVMFSSPLGSKAQQTEASRLFIKKIQVYDSYVSVTYELNFPGFVELHLSNPEGRKIWIRGKVADQVGVHSVKINREPMEKGKRYSFILKYKGKDYSGSFYNEKKDT